MEIILAEEPGFKLNGGCCCNSIHFQSVEWRFPFQLDGNLNGQIDILELVETQEKPVEKPKEKEIPYRTLVLHRFLVLLVMVLILAVGIIVNQILSTVVTWKKSQKTVFTELITKPTESSTLQTPALPDVRRAHEERQLPAI